MSRSAPVMSDDQRAVGRERALAGRRLRAELKAEVRAGRIGAAQVVAMAGADDDAGRAAARMRIGELLLSVPGVGAATAERALVEAGVSGQRRLGQLGPRQRERLGGLL
jgi:hypothetical protein